MVKEDRSVGALGSARALIARVFESMLLVAASMATLVVVWIADLLRLRNGSSASAREDEEEAQRWP